MPEGTDGLGTIRIDAPAEQERRLAVVVLQQCPVELLARTSVLGCLGVEQEIIAQALVGLGGLQVFGLRDGKGLDEVEAAALQRLAIAGRLHAVQLEVVQPEAVGIHRNFFFRLIDEDAHAPGFPRQVFGHLAEATRGFRVEVESYQVHAQVFCLADVVGLRHAADFNQVVLLFHLFPYII